MFDERDFVCRLADLVALDTVSPMAGDGLARASAWLSTYAFERLGDSHWAAGPEDAGVLVYSHIDTKPPLPRERWTSHPFSLCERGGRLIGLGVSDAKFQLLNAIDVFRDRAVRFVVDAEEEIGGSAAAQTLAASGARRLVLVDGASDSDVLCAMTAGQIDGVLNYCSGQPGQHPGRGPRWGAADWLAQVIGSARLAGLHFNITGLAAAQTVRSLTVEEVNLRFDLRYTPDELPAVESFLEGKDAQVRQHYPPLYGRRRKGQVARFSCALGAVVKDLDEVFVAAGALPENGNHRPDEWIDVAQVLAHRARLRELIAELRLERTPWKPAA